MTATVDDVVGNDRVTVEPSSSPLDGTRAPVDGGPRSTSAFAWRYFSGVPMSSQYASLLNANSAPCCSSIRGNVSRSIETLSARRDAIEEPRFEHVGARVDPVPRRASRGGGFSTNAMTWPSGAVGTTPNALGSSTSESEIVASASVLVVERDHRAEVERREDVAVAHDEALVDPVGRVLDRTRGAERLVLDLVVQAHAAEAAVGKCALERVGAVAERQHDLVDAVRREPLQLAFEERLVRDRQQRLRCREGERAQPGALAPDEHDRLHERCHGARGGASCRRRWHAGRSARSS